MPRRTALLALAFLASPAGATDRPPDAVKAEAAGDWQTAAAVYHQAGDKDQAQVCLRRLAQARRLADPAFARFAATVRPVEALDLYAEAVEKLAALYADPAAAAPARQFARGVEELSTALADATFQSAVLPGPAGPGRAAAVGRFQHTLAADYATRKPVTAADARQAAFDLVRAARSDLGVRHASPLVFELLAGAAGGLDEYTAYTPPAGPDPAGTELAEYGLTVRPVMDGVIIEAVRPDSWAAVHTLLAPGDRLVTVNGHRLSASGMVLLAVALRNPGPAGHTLEPDAGPAVRLPVPAPTVYALDPPAGTPAVGVVRVDTFRPATPDELDEVLAQFHACGVRAVVVDLRGNPGGSFPAALAVAGRLVGGGLVASSRGQLPEFAGQDFVAPPPLTGWAGPLVVLADGRTASAAEVVAAACADRGRATVVGEPTFGKGVVQSAPVPLHAADRAGTLTVTVATLFTPAGRPLHRAGVTPHVPVSDPARQLETAAAKAQELADRAARR